MPKMQFTFLANNAHIYEKTYTLKLMAILNSLVNCDDPDYGALVVFFKNFIDYLKTKMAPALTARPISYYVIEGNIGSGKSTLLKSKASVETSNVVVVPEPLKFWQGLLAYHEDSGEIFSNIFEQFYAALNEAKSKMIMLFQIVALFSRLVYIIHSVEEHPAKSKFVSERSFLSDRIFFEISKHRSSAAEIEHYYECHDLCSDFLQDITEGRIFFYFHKVEEEAQANVAVCLHRIKKRNRAGEEEITSEYLAQVEEKTRIFEASIISSAKIDSDTFLQIFDEK